MPTQKPIIRKKGRLADGRSRYVIEFIDEEGKKRNKAIPTPETLLIMMDTLKKLDLYTEEMEEKNTYKYYLKEIEELKKEFNLSATDCLSLQIAASFKFNNLDYNELKKELSK